VCIINRIISLVSINVSLAQEQVVTLTLCSLLFFFHVSLTYCLVAVSLRAPHLVTLRPCIIIYAAHCFVSDFRDVPIIFSLGTKLYVIGLLRTRSIRNHYFCIQGRLAQTLSSLPLSGTQHIVEKH